MYRYTVWPGAYSFKNEIDLFIEYTKEQFAELFKEVQKTEEAVEQPQG